MAFDGNSLCKIIEWWNANGNPAIHIFLDYCGRLTFYDTKRGERVVSIMRVDGEPCVIDYDVKGYMFTDYLFTNDPFTDQEHQELEKFMRANDAKFYD